MTDKQRAYLESLVRKVFNEEKIRCDILSRIAKLDISGIDASRMIHALRLELNIRKNAHSSMLLASNLNPRMDDFYKILGFDF